MAYDVMLSQTPQALRTPVVWRLPGCGGGKTALFCGAAQTLGAELQALGTYFWSSAGTPREQTRRR